MQVPSPARPRPAPQLQAGIATAGPASEASAAGLLPAGEGGDDLGPRLGVDRDRAGAVAEGDRRIMLLAAATERRPNSVEAACADVDAQLLKRVSFNHSVTLPCQAHVEYVLIIVRLWKAVRHDSAESRDSKFTIVCSRHARLAPSLLHSHCCANIFLSVGLSV